MTHHIKSLIRLVPDFPTPGIRFRDVMGLVENAEGFEQATEALVRRFAPETPDAVAGIEARGFIFGVAVAQRLGVGFVPVRKAGKLPGEVVGVDYALEYGTGRLEMQTGSIRAGMRVLLIDDLVATGGSAAAAIELIRGMGGEVAGAGFVVDLPELPGRKHLEAMGVEIFALCTFLDADP
ncbi:MAG: adenine phosphoribosyltransferase [Gammaproteobacteria bacterium]|nr:adenine phosphoribosyltransferase [Gammaproteobacteria bacterium]MYF60788.1 adenine phosphoribosyltransferase [Gammaproteobacteria bacterium]MYI22487.1 adenine phosphoribosyltransferase [Gammaproteobacteria bacterium]